MAMKPCRECGREISTHAKACPNCGAQNPTGSDVTVAHGCLGCLGLVVVFGLIGALANSFDTAGSSPKNTASAAAARFNPDSLWAMGQIARLDSLSRADSVRYDRAFHAHGAAVPHADVFHRRVVSIRIAEARANAGNAATRGTALEYVTAADTPFTSSQAQAIESLRKSITSSIERDARRAQIPVRQAYAQTLRTKFLDSNLDIKVSTTGAEATTLEFKFVLFNDVWSHKLVTGEFMADLRSRGFKKFVMTDGYDWGYSWNL